MILIDTSAWIDFFQNRAPFSEQVDECLEENRAALCGPVVTEIRRGFRSENDRKEVLPLLQGCHFLRQPEFLWEEAGDCGFVMKQSGENIKTMDLLIASFAMAHQVPILTKDEDFRLIREAGFMLEIVGKV